MPFTIAPLESEAPHMWGIAVATCNLEDANDLLIATTVDLVRRSYGEYAVMADASNLLSEQINSGFFDLRHLLAAIREGLPDPEKEGKKPVQLTNYRSQSAEMVAKAALSKAYNYQYPAAPQEAAANPNQPILNFDGWGILQSNNGEVSLALIQVKATDAKKSPPRDAIKLAKECRRAPTDRSAILRALASMVRLLRGDPIQTSILWMMEKLGRPGETIPILVSPVIVRGVTTPAPKDLDPIMSVANDILPASIRALVVSIGTPLDDFGYLVMGKARETI
jgi:hypothetical protein